MNTTNSEPSKESTKELSTLRRELRGAHLALRSLEGRVRDFFDHCPVMILILDAQGAVIDTNAAALRALGRPAETIIGQPLADVAAVSSREALQRLFDDMPDVDDPDHRPRPQELLLVTATGTLATSAQFTAVRAQDGTPIEIHLMMTDLSEVHRLQQRVYQENRLASVGQLAAGVAHEINNPAAFVLANLGHLQGALPALGRLQAGLAKVPGLSSDDQRRLDDLIADLPGMCDQSMQGMRRIRDIVRDLQVFARGADDSPEPLDCNALCDTVANMAWLEIRRRARLEKDYALLPPIHGHPGKLSQVLMNLVINAAQSIPEGHQAQNKIVLRTERSGEGVAISVIDTGAGIPQAVLPRIFDPFFTTKPPGQGTGLGLSLSHEIVKNHGGQIQVQSQVGQGSTFTVWLPVPAGARPMARRPSRPTATPSTEPPRVHITCGGGTAGKVLVIDDELDFLRAVRRTLTPEHEVILCESGEDGMRLLKEHPDVDVVLCDLMMPEITGMDLYECLPVSLRERFLFLSGDIGSAAVRAFLESLPTPPLLKPVEPELLRSEVARAVARRRGQGQAEGSKILG